MKLWIVAGAGLALMAATGVAVAQAPSPPGPPGMEGQRPDEGPGMHHWGRMGMMRMHMHPMSKAAHFRFRRGDAVVDIKCADDEPTKACVDASSALMDKLAATQK